MTALDKAIKAAGSARKLSMALGVTSMSISHWKHRDRGIVPPDYILKIHSIAGVTPTNCALICIRTQRMDYLCRKRGRNRAFNFISTKYRVSSGHDDKSQSA